MRKPCLHGKAALARQRGQALAFALIFLVVGALALFTAFNASQLSSAKTKLQNTADATAYSVAVLQARDYNFAAYTNRAMVANQAAVAQVLSLKSWIDEVSETAQSDHVVDTLINVFADLGEVEWNLPKQTARPMISPLKSTIDSLAPTVVKGLDILNWSLSTAQHTYRLATLASYPLVANEVAQANEPNTTADEGYMATLGAPKFFAWKNYVTRTDPKQQASGGSGGPDRFADVVTDKDTLDNFVPERGAIRTPTVASTAEKGCVGAVFSFMAVGEPHKGATQLRPDLGGWEALDATAAVGDLTSNQQTALVTLSVANSSDTLRQLWPGWNGFTASDKHVLLTNGWTPDGSSGTLAQVSNATPIKNAGLMGGVALDVLAWFAPDILGLDLGKIAPDVVPADRLGQ